MPQTGGDGTSGTYGPKDRLAELISDWQDLQEEIREFREFNQDNPDFQYTDQLKRLRRRLERKTDRIDQLLGNNPNLVEWASKHGYGQGGSDTGNSPETYDDDKNKGGGNGRNQQGSDAGGTRGGSGGSGGANARRQARDNRLLDGGKLVRGPKGTYSNVYTYKVDGETFRVAVKLGKEGALAKYGLKASDARQLNKQQMKRIQNIGHADELAPHMKKGDKHALKSLTRYLNNQYEGQSILNDDEVMSVIIANSMFGWSPGEFENQLRNTKWWRNTEEYQRNWQTTMSPKARKNAINSTLENVVNELEDNYGVGWIKHVEGGMKKAREWAERIASGVWGTPDAGMEFWRNKMFDRAAKIEGTPAWIMEQQEQEQIREYNNRPEDVFEQLRSESMHYLGQVDGKPLIDRGTLMGWATDIATERRSEGDWQKFLRQQMKTLHPYFDENVAFKEQASPYLSVYESIMGTPGDWDNKLFRNFQAFDDTGKPRQGDAMNLHEFELMLRDPTKNPDAYQEGTSLYDEGMNMLSGVLARMRGVS